MVDERKAPDGYRVTDVGVIPDDWEVKKLAEICTLSNQKYNPKKNTDNFPCIELEHISPEIGRLLGTTNSLDQLSMKNFFFKGDTLLGKLRPYLKKYLYAYFDGVCSTEIWVLRPQNDTDDRYLYYMIQSEKVIDACNKSSGTKMPRAEWKVVQDTIIQLPPLQEQKSIAEALSDTDNLIQSVEKLIDKKKKIKQGAMQQLLTGKKRLPGFSGEWNEYKITDIAIVGRGRVISHREINNSIEKLYPVYSSQTSNEGIMGYIDSYDFEGDYMTWTTDGVNAGKVFYRSGKFNCTNVCGTIKLKQFDHEFVSMALDNVTDKYVSKNLANPKLMNDVMKNIEITLPSIEEQKAIAQALSDMDTEIKALEEKLEKVKTIKQGMMQELLTGRIRLI